MKKSGLWYSFFKPLKMAIYVYLSFLNTSAFSQSKRALIIAIGNYAPETGWESISSANDVPMIKEALTRQGFEDIDVISNEQATKKGVEVAFEKLLIKTQKDDIVYIHFSTHGQQIEDLSGDEVDGFDEAIICYDSPKKLTQGYMGERHLTDDELAEWLLKLRQKAGNKGDILLMADACHSGTVSRSVGTLKVRGGAAPLLLTGKEIKTSKSRESFLSNDEKIESDKSNLAPYAIISGSSANQLNSEVMDNDFNTFGSLSFAFNKVISQASSNETYRSLFAKIQSEMKVLFLSQTPEIEGILDRKIWAGALVEEMLYFGINASDLDLDLERDEIEINGGEVQGISEGSKIELFPVGIYASGEIPPAFEGVVTKTNAFTAIVKLNKNLDLKQYWAYVSERAYGNVFTNVSFQGFEQLGSLKVKILESRIIKNEPNLKVDLILKQMDNGEVAIFKAGTMESFGKPFKINDGTALITAIENFTKSKFLLGFNPSSQELNAKLEMVPSTSKLKKDIVSVAKFIHNGLLELAENQNFFLKIINDSDVRIYYNIIDIDAENNIAVVIPEPQDFDGKDYWVEPHSEAFVSKNKVEINFEVYPPFGSETLKLFVSDAPLDLRSLSNQKSRNLTMNPLSDLEKVFDFTGKMSTRSVDAATYTSKTKASSYALNFEIVPVDIKK